MRTHAYQRLLQQRQLPEFAQDTLMKRLLCNQRAPHRLQPRDAGQRHERGVRAAGEPVRRAAAEVLCGCGAVSGEPAVVATGVAVSQHGRKPVRGQVGVVVRAQAVTRQHFERGVVASQLPFDIGDRNRSHEGVGESLLGGDLSLGDELEVGQRLAWYVQERACTTRRLWDLIELGKRLGWYVLGHACPVIRSPTISTSKPRNPTIVGGAHC